MNKLRELLHVQCHAPRREQVMREVEFLVFPLSYYPRKTFTLRHVDLIVVLEVYTTQHSIEIKLCFSL
jgi:hypothetical protein